MPVVAEEVYRWHARPGAFERLAAPWARLEVLERHGSIHDGDRLVLRLRLAPGVWKRWVAVHRDHLLGRRFVDVQEQGPFAAFAHTHSFEPADDGRSILRDRIVYRPPLGALGRLIAGRRVRRDLARAFAYRHRVTADDLAAHAGWGRLARRRVLVTGSHGLLGSALVPFLTTGGHEVLRLVRGSARVGEIAYDPAAARLATTAWPRIDAVVHLAGENIAARRWSARQKERIRASRVEGTRRLAEALAALPAPPRVLVCASAVGVYGHRGDETLLDDPPAAPGTGFLADTGRAWEEAAAPARAAGIRTVHLRFGALLSPAGGALGRMLPAFRAGLGGRIGPGTQWLPWLALDDALDVVLRALLDERLSGPLHAVAPEAVTQATFARTLGRVLGRPSVLPLPARAARLAFGELADAVLLASQRVVPARLQALEHRFRLPTLEGALRHLLGAALPAPGGPA